MFVATQLCIHKLLPFSSLNIILFKSPTLFKPFSIAFHHLLFISVILIKIRKLQQRLNFKVFSEKSKGRENFFY